jgi:hypothetical protein
VPESIAIESLGIGIQQRITPELEQRVARVAVTLVQLMQRAYEQEFKVNDAGGAVSSLTFEITRTRQFLEVAFGSSKSNSYLRYLEFGVKPAAGAQYAAHQKAPPLKSIYDWIRRAKLLVPRYYIDRGEQNAKRKHKSDKPWYSSDPLTLFAFDIAQAIKRKGRPALHVIERVLTQQVSRIEAAFNS